MTNGTPSARADNTPMPTSDLPETRLPYSLPPHLLRRRTAAPRSFNPHRVIFRPRRLPTQTTRVGSNLESYSTRLALLRSIRNGRYDPSEGSTTEDNRRESYIPPVADLNVNVVTMQQIRTRQDARQRLRHARAASMLLTRLAEARVNRAILEGSVQRPQRGYITRSLMSARVGRHTNTLQTERHRRMYRQMYSRGPRSGRGDDVDLRLRAMTRVQLMGEFGIRQPREEHADGLDEQLVQNLGGMRLGN